MFRFTIRDLLWLMVVVAVCLGWWNEHRRFTAYYEMVVSSTKWTPTGGGAQSVKDDAAILEAVINENASLKEENELQKKLIETYKAERQEIRDKSGPTT